VNRPSAPPPPADAPGTPPVLVSVLIPVLDEEGHLREAADAALAQELSGQAEFLFIDGGSEDGSPAILHELSETDPRVRVLTNPARRTPHALNIGLAAARGEFIARMDAHTIYPPRYLSSGVRRLQAGDVEWVSGPQLAIGTNPGSARVARALGASLGRGGARYRDALRAETEVDSGFTGMWRRETLLRHGGWNEEWVNDQDLELAARIRRDGGRIVCIPEMAAQYVPRDTLRRVSRQYVTYGMYRVKTAQRHPETLRPSQLLPPAVTVTAAVAVAAPRTRLRALARAGLAAYALALTGAAGRGGGDRPRSDLVALPAIWMTMHVSYGMGFARGCVRYGLPVRAVAQAVARFGGGAQRGRVEGT
jgi:succinoglycan biosynthesis protein ExoA